nr:uncharacterized protein LOC109166492 [Ipomoea batatas]
MRNGILTKEFLDGLQTFIEFATSQHSWMDGERIRCPCTQRKCQNTKFLDVPTVKYHLARFGFVSDYYVWRFHGERIVPVDVDRDVGGPSQTASEEASNAYHTMVMDVARVEFNVDEIEESLNFEAQKFYDMLKAMKKYKHAMILQRKKLKTQLRTKGSSFINGNSSGSSATSQLHQEAMKDMMNQQLETMLADMEAKLQAEMDAKLQAERNQMQTQMQAQMQTQIQTQIQAQSTSLMDELRRNFTLCELLGSESASSGSLQLCDGAHAYIWFFAGVLVFGLRSQSGVKGPQYP